MKGLLLNNFYSSMGNIKMFLFLVVTVAAAVLVTGNPTAQELFVYLTITALSFNSVVSSRKDAASKWARYEITLPVRRKEIIQSKYLSYIFWVGVGTAVALTVTVLTMLLHSNSNLLNGMENFYSMFVLGIGISLFTCSFFYPLSYIAGVDKSETILIVSVLCSIGLTIGALLLLNGLNFSFAVRMTVFVVSFLAALALSYCLAVFIYSKKEF